MSGKIVGSVRGQVLHLIYPPLVEGTVDYLTAEFSFSGDWDGLSKWAHFKQGSTIYDVPLTNDAITEDQHLNLSAGTWDVYLHGSGDNRRITTTTVRMKVLPYLDEDGEPLPEVPLTFAEVLDQRAQRIQAVAYAVEAGESVRKEAERSRELSEFARIQAEAERTGAENSRSSAEDTRKQNEEERQAAEAVREQNEEARVEAEKNRKDGITPHIGDNGNWYLGDTDTGKPSRGETGPQGPKGDTGETGPSGVYVGSGEMPDGYNVQIDPSGDASIQVDSTLTQSGQAADAAKVGEELRSLSEEIENLSGSGSGLSSNAKTVLIAILRNGVYTGDQSSNITALEAELTSGGSGDADPDAARYTVTNNLTNVTTSNAAVSAAGNSVYTARLTAADGYNLGTVIVTMGGADITSTAFSGNAVVIASVTGDIVITATATQSMLPVSITDIVRGSVSFGNAALIVNGETVTRCTVLPIGQYLEKGKTYKFSIGEAYPNYNFGVAVFVASEADLVFELVNGSIVNYDTVISKISDSGWITDANSYEYTAPDSNLIFAMNFKRSDGEVMNDVDRTALLASATIKAV